MDASSSKNNESKFTEDLTGTEWYDPNGKKIGGLQDMLALKKKAAAKQAKPTDKNDKSDDKPK